MKTRLFKLTMIFGLFMLLGLTVNAQDLALRAQIPFDFHFGDVTMMAGNYDLNRLNIGGGVFQVQDRHLRNSAMRVVYPMYDRMPAKETILVFNRYRDNGGEETYFLTKIWIEGMDRGYEFITHPTERAAAARAARRDIITVAATRVDHRGE